MSLAIHLASWTRLARRCSLLITTTMASSIAVCSIASSRGTSVVGLRPADRRRSTRACRASTTNGSVPLKTHQHSSDDTCRRKVLLTSSAALSLVVPEVTTLLMVVFQPKDSIFEMLWRKKKSTSWLVLCKREERDPS